MNAPDAATPDQIRQNRKILYLLFGVGFVPLLLATFMYYSNSFIPTGRTNEGTLILPPLQWQDWDTRILKTGLQAEESGIDNSKWHLIVINAGECQQACEQSLYLARQVNVALGRRADRLERYFLTTGNDSPLINKLHEQYPRMHQASINEQQLRQSLAAVMDSSQALQQSYILLADPLGNIMMYYTPEQSGNDMLSDLKNLLKLSNIG